MNKLKLSIMQNQRSWTFWLVMCFVSVFLFVSPFYRGLFNGNQITFERPIQILMTWSAVALIAISVYLFKHWKLKNQTDLMGILIWLIPLSYLISMLNAASYHSAIYEFYLHIVYAIFFLIGAYFYKHSLGAAILQYGLLGSGYVVVIHGLLNWFGNVLYKEAVLANQLAGAFQYPNTYAAYLIGILIANLITITNSKRWYTIIPNAFMLLPIMVSILLTLSRGAGVILPIALLIYFILIPWRKQLFVLLYLTLAGGTALAVQNNLTEIQQKLSQQFVGAESFKGWTIVIALSLLISIVIYAIHKFVAVPQLLKHTTNKVIHLKNLIIPSSLIVIGIIGVFLIFGNNSLSDKLPNGLKERIQATNDDDSSIASRKEFYKDSFKIWGDYPVFGAGGGAWSSLYNQYKSFPYISAQTHNVISQVLVDTGLFGMIIFAGFIGLCLYIFIRFIIKRQSSEWDEKRLVLPLFGLTILLHSMLDFDMSFIYISALLFLSLGVLVSVSESKAQSPHVSLKKMTPVMLYPAIAVILAIVVFVNAFQAIRADKLYKQAQEAGVTTHNYNDVIKPLDAALKLQQNHPGYNLFKISLLLQVYDQTKQEQFISEADALLHKLQSREPYNRQMIEGQYSLLIAKGEYDQAAQWSESNLSKFPWDVNLYEKVIMLNFDAGYQALLQGANGQKEKYWKQALASFEQFTNKINEIRALPTNLQAGYVFDVTPKMALSIGQIHFMDQDYHQAEKVLRGQMSGNIADQTEREITRWYIASRIKQNLGDDTGLYDLLNKEGPADEEKIQEILNSTR